MILGVLLDFDGVVMPVNLVLKALKETLRKFGIDVTDEFIEDRIIGRRIVDSLPEIFGVPLDEAISIRSRYHQVYLNLALNSKPLPGVIELFNFCRKTGIKTAIVSTKTRPETQPIIDKLGLHPDATVFQEDVKMVKPNPEPVLLAASKLGIQPEKGVYIGDHVFDMQAGKAAGMLAIGVLTGVGKGDELLAAGADMVFPSLVEFLSWLKSTNV